MPEMTFSTLAIVLTMVAQTIAIGFFIGSIKTVVDRLVKDVEKISRDIIDGFKESSKEVREAEASIAALMNNHIVHETKIESLFVRISNLEGLHHELDN